MGSTAPDLRGGESSFVGRRRELATVEGEFRRRDPGLTTIVVAGEPGIGKSRFLAEVGRHAQEQGWLVAAGQATEHERELPFAVFDAALSPVVMRHPAAVPRLPVALAQALTVVLPAIRTDSGPVVEVIRHRAYVAVVALLEQLCAGRGLLVVLDDLHWADTGTVELIDHLVRHRPAGRVVLALAYRDHQVSGRLAAVLTQAGSTGTGRDIRLGPLSRAETAELLGQDAATARRLHEVTEGNPLYLTSLARAGVTGWSADLPLPADVSAALAAEVEALPADGRIVIQAAAVLGTVFDPEPLATVADLPEHQVAALVDRLVAADLLRADPGSGRLRFRHPLIRHVVYATTGAGWRRTAHARAMHLLTARGASADLLAHHVTQSAPIGDEAAIRVLVRAAAASQWRAPATAAQWYGAALRLLPQDWRWPARRGRLLLTQAECLMAAGLLPESRRASAEALPLLRRRAPSIRRRAVLVAAQVNQLLGQRNEAAALLRQASDQPGLGTADLRLQLTVVELLRGDLAAAWALAHEVRRGAAGGPLDFGASSVLAFVYVSSGDAAEAGRMAEAAGESLDRLSDVELARHLTPLVWLMWADVNLARYRRALRCQDRGLEPARTGGHLHSLTQLLIGRAETLRRTGRLVQARQCAEEAHDLARLSGSAELTLFALTTLCRVVIFQGTVADAQRCGVEIETMAAEVTGLFGTLGGAIAAEARLLAGQPTQCRAGLLAAGGGDALPYFDPSTQVLLYEVLTRAALATDQLDEAHTWVTRAAEIASRGVLPGAAGYPALADAQVLLARDRPDEALVRAQQAAEEFDLAEHPVDQARAWLITARALAGLGRRDEALGQLTLTEELTGHCGAERLRAEAIRELRRLGRRVPSGRDQPRDRAQLLSQREQQVAELAGQGQTNRAIAATLFLSEKTIERHLSSAFTKLGVSSRTALAVQLLTRAGSA